MPVSLTNALITFFSSSFIALLLSSITTLANFEYEYTLVGRLFLWILIPCLVTVCERRFLKNGRSFGLTECFQINCIVVLGFASVSFPAFYFNLCKCSPQHYLYWFSVNILSGAFLSSGIYLTLKRLTSKRADEPNKTRKLTRATTLLGLALVTLGLLDLGLFWFFPQVRFVSLLAGYIHGPIYDELLLQDQSILVASGLQLSAGLLLQIAYFSLRGFSSALATILAALLLALPSIQGLATRVGMRHIETELSLKKSADSWTMYYSPLSNSDSIADLTREIEFHTNDLQAILKLKLPHIHIFIYPNAQMKKFLFGGLDTDVTDVFTPSIHIREETGVHSTLRHELVHAALSGIGFHGLGFHPNMALTEGLAVALAPDPFEDKTDEVASLAMEDKSKEYLESLFGIEFYIESGPKAYSVAGSWIRHLIELGQIEKLLRVYSGQSSHQQYFSRLPGKVYIQWTEKLTRIRGRAKDLETMRKSALPSLWESTCPHSVAEFWHADRKLAAEAAFKKSIGIQAEELTLFKERLRSTQEMLTQLKTDEDLREHFEWLTLVTAFKETKMNRTGSNKLSCGVLMPDLSHRKEANQSGPANFKTSIEAERYLNFIDCLALEGSYAPALSDLQHLFGSQPSQPILGDRLYRSIVLRREVLGTLLDSTSTESEKILANRAILHLARIENFSSKKKPVKIDVQVRNRWAWLYLAILSGDPRTIPERQEALEKTFDEVIRKNLMRTLAKYSAVTSE